MKLTESFGQRLLVKEELLPDVGVAKDSWLFRGRPETGWLMAIVERYLQLGNAPLEQETGPGRTGNKESMYSTIHSC